MNRKEFIHTRLNSYSSASDPLVIDGKSYKTVKIGNQVWMTENLAYDDGKGGITVRDGNHYYTWDAAMRVAAGIKGWKLPSVEEWDQLALSLGGIKTKSYPNGGYEFSYSENMISKFNTKLAGLYYNSIISFNLSAYFWASTKEMNNSAYLVYLSPGDFLSIYQDSMNMGLSVRLIKD